MRKFFAILFFIFPIVWVFLSCLVCTRYGQSIVFDGLGRVLTPAPFLMRFIFDADKLWAGWAWFLGDATIFWGSIGIGCLLISPSFNKNKRKNGKWIKSNE